VQPTAQVNVSAPGAALAGFQVSINGRFWVSTEETIVPWACLWLYYYEVWHTTGEWLGGGLHPSARRPRRRA